LIRVIPAAGKIDAPALRSRHAGAGRHPRFAFVPQAKSWMPACAGMTGTINHFDRWYNLC
jgi:hypothetical protein